MLANSLRTTATALNVVQGPLGPLAGRVTAVSRALTELTGFRLGIVGVGAALFGIARVATNFTELENRLRPLYGTQREVNQALNDVVGVAGRARTSLEPVTEVYVRLTSLAKEYGLTQSQVSRQTETISKLAAQSGGSQESRNLALIQFTQALGLNRFSGQELRSVETGAFALAKGIADNFRNADGSIGTTIANLKALGEAGELNTRRVLDATLRASSSADLQSSKQAQTIPQAGAKFVNQVTLGIGRLNESVGITDRIAGSISNAADNLRGLLVLAGGLGGAFAASRSLEYVRGLSAGLLDAIHTARNLVFAPQRGALPARSQVGIDAVRTATLAAQTADAKRAADAEASYATRNLDVQQRRLAVSRENLAVARAEQGLAVSGRDARTPALEAEIVLLREREDIVSRSVAENSTAARVDVEAKQQQLTAARALTAQRRADLDAVAAQQVAYERQLLATQRAGGLIARNPNVANETVRANLLAENTAAQAEAELGLARSKALTEGASRRVALAIQEETAATTQFGLARRSANEAAAAGIAGLKASEGAIAARIAAERELALAIEATTAAQIAAKDISLAAATNDVANASARAGFAFLREAEAIVVARVATEAATLAQTEATIAQRAFAAAAAFSGRALAGFKAGLSAIGGVLASAQLGIGLLTAGLLLLATRTDGAKTALDNFAGGQEALLARLNVASLAIDKQASSYRALAADAAKANIEGLKQTRQSARNSLADSLSDARAGVDVRSRQGRSDFAAIGGYANSIRTGQFSVQKDYAGLSTVMNRNPAAFQQSGGVGGYIQQFLGSNPADTVNKVKGLAAAEFELADAQKAVRDASKPEAPFKPAPVSRSIEEMRNLAQQNAEQGSDPVRQRAETARKVAYDKLNDQFKKYVQNGVLPGQVEVRGQVIETTAQYQKQANAIEATYQAAIRSDRAQRAGNQQARKDIADLIAQTRLKDQESTRDAKSAAETQLQKAQQALEERAPGETRDDYLSDRLQNLQTYDKQVNAISARERALAELDQRARSIGSAKYLAARAQIIASYADEIPAIEAVADASHKAEDQRTRDARAVADARTDIVRSGQEQVEVARLTLAGHDAEAQALQHILDLRRTIGSAADDLLPELLAQAREQEHINSLLASRERIVSSVMGAVDGTRADFEKFLTDLPSRGTAAAGDLFKSLTGRLRQIDITNLTEQLFAGADEKVKALLEGRSSADVAIAGFSDSLKATATAVDDFASSVEAATKRIDAAASGAVDPAAAYGAVSVASPVGAAGAAFAKSAVDAVDEIVVTGRRRRAEVSTALGGGGNGDGLSVAVGPSGRSTIRALVGTIGGNVDRLLAGLGVNTGGGYQAHTSPKNSTYNREDGGTLDLPQITTTSASGFFARFGDKLGQGLGGAATGAAVNGIIAPIGKALGVKTSKTGSEIGGAVGAVAASSVGLPPELGSILGSIQGGIIGGLFKKTKSGSATLGSDGTISTQGNSSARQVAASADVTSVKSGVQSVADQLGATLSALSAITIGTYGKNDEYRVNTTGGSTLGGSKNAIPGVAYFGSGDQGREDAIAFAINLEIQRGVLKGISRASQNILASGQDLQTAIQKALVIENIPKQLKAFTDPVGAAIDTLNDQFSKTIAILKEGGATAEQFAQASQLYDLQRAQAIKQAQTAASDTLKQFLDDMVAGSNSPLSKRDTFTNAKTQLDTFRSDISAGKAVDSDALLTASKNYQEALRNLYGSGQQFFDGFNDLRDLITRAQTNATSASSTTGTGPLADSPFVTDTGVAAIISSTSTSQIQALTDQTATLGQGLANVESAINGLAGSRGYADSSAIGLLAGFNYE